MLVDRLNSLVFEKEYQFSTWIRSSLESDNKLDCCLISRVKAVFLSVVSAVALLADLIYIGTHTLLAIAFSVIHLKSPLQYPSNIRTVLLVAAEFARHIGGTIAGTLLALFSPKMAIDFLLPHDQSEMKVTMNKQEAAKLYCMLQFMDELFEQEGIKYSATAGTQLGLSRNNGIIPNDDDCDVATEFENKAKILSLKEKFSERGIGIAECDLGIKLYDQYSSKKLTEEFPKAGTIEYNYPFIDVCFFEKIDGKLVYENNLFRTLFAGEFFTENEWNSLEKLPFGPTHIYGLAEQKGIEFCKRAYGETCFTYSFTAYNHQKANGGPCSGVVIPKKIYLKYEKGQNHCAPIEYDHEAFENGLKILDSEEAI